MIGLIFLFIGFLAQLIINQDKANNNDTIKEKILFNKNQGKSLNRFNLLEDYEYSLVELINKEILKDIPIVLENND